MPIRPGPCQNEDQAVSGDRSDSTRPDNCQVKMRERTFSRTEKFRRLLLQFEEKKYDSNQKDSRRLRRGVPSGHLICQIRAAGVTPHTWIATIYQVRR